MQFGEPAAQIRRIPQVLAQVIDAAQFVELGGHGLFQAFAAVDDHENESMPKMIAKMMTTGNLMLSGNGYRRSGVKK